MQASRSNGGSWVVSPDGKHLVTFDGMQQTKLFDLATGKELLKFGDALNRGNGGGLAFSPDGKLFATLGNDPMMGHSLIHLWDVSNGKEVRKLEGPEPKAGEQRFNPNNVVFSPNGKFIAASGYGRPGEMIHAWEVETGKALPVFVNPGSKATVSDILEAIFDNNPGMEMFSPVGLPLFSPDSKTLVGIIQNNRRGSIKLRAWDPITGKHIRDLGDHPNGINNVVFAPDSKRIAVTARRPVRADDRREHRQGPARHHHRQRRHRRPGLLAGRQDRGHRLQRSDASPARRGQRQGTARDEGLRGQLRPDEHLPDAARASKRRSPSRRTASD